MIEKNWKYYLGMTCFILSFVFPLIGFLIPFLGLPLALMAFLTGFLMFGGPEIMIVLAVVFLGKPVLNQIKEKFFKLFKRKKPYKPVSRFRYYLGIVIFFGSFTPFYLNGYAPHLLPDHEVWRLYIFIGSDLVFILSFFILGGNFWEKFKKLFIWDEKKAYEEECLPK